MNRVSERRRGRLLITVGVIGVLIAVAIAGLGWQLTGQISRGAVASLDLSADALSSVDDTISIVRDTVGSVSDGVSTLRVSVGDASGTLGNAGELFDSTATIASEDVVGSIESVRSALPPLISSAQVLDGVLDALGSFGIANDRTQPIDAPLQDINDDLLILETRLSQQAGVLEGIATDFATFASSADELEDNLAAIDDDLVEARSILDGYEQTADMAEATIASTREQIDQGVATARTLVIAVASLFALGQIAPITIGRMAIDRPESIDAVTTDRGNADAGP